MNLKIMLLLQIIFYLQYTKHFMFEIIFFKEVNIQNHIEL